MAFRINEISIPLNFPAISTNKMLFQIIIWQFNTKKA